MARRKREKRRLIVLELNLLATVATGDLSKFVLASEHLAQAKCIPWKDTPFLVFEHGACKGGSAQNPPTQ